MGGMATANDELPWYRSVPPRRNLWHFLLDCALLLYLSLSLMLYSLSLLNDSAGANFYIVEAGSFKHAWDVPVSVITPELLKVRLNWDLARTLHLVF